MEDTIKIELLTPLTGNFTSRELERQWEEGEYEYDVYEGLPLDGADLLQYESEIKEAIEKYNAIGNEEGKPSEDYKQSKVNINGLPMTKTTNPLRIGHPDEKGEEMQQTVLLYFQENKRRVFAIVMLVADEKAQADLDAITSSIQIEK